MFAKACTIDTAFAVSRALIWAALAVATKASIARVAKALAVREAATVAGALFWTPGV